MSHDVFKCNSSIPLVRTFFTLFCGIAPHKLPGTHRTAGRLLLAGSAGGSASGNIGRRLAKGGGRRKGETREQFDGRLHLEASHPSFRGPGDPGASPDRGDATRSSDSTRRFGDELRRRRTKDAVGYYETKGGNGGLHERMAELRERRFPWSSCQDWRQEERLLATPGPLKPGPKIVTGSARVGFPTVQSGSEGTDSGTLGAISLDLFARTGGRAGSASSVCRWLATVWSGRTPCSLSCRLAQESPVTSC